MRRITLETDQDESPLVLLSPGALPSPSSPRDITPIAPILDAPKAIVSPSTPLEFEQIALGALAVILAIHVTPLGQVWDSIASPWQRAVGGERSVVKRERREQEKRSPSQPRIASGKIFFPIAGETLDSVRIADVPGSCRPLGSCTRRHAGLDLVPKGKVYGHPIISPFDGRITEVKPQSAIGGILGITSKDGKYLVRLVHINRKETARWRIGQEVSAGQRVSSMDYEDRNWGSGIHLHLELYVNRQLSMRPQPFWKEAEKFSK